MAAEIPHLAFPFALTADGTKLTVVEQDSPEHIMGCENVIVRCDRGARSERPEFGWPFPTFRTTPLDLSELEAALAQWEPRGKASVSEWADEADAATRHIAIEVS